MRRHRLDIPNILVFVVVIGVIGAILASMIWPEKGNPAAAKRAKCMAYLKMQSAAFFAYSANYSHGLPATSGKLASFCEQGSEARDAIASAVSGPTTLVPRIFYCPANAAQDPAKLWNGGGVSTWGYAWMNERGLGADLPATFPARRVPLQYISDPSDRNIRSPASVILALDVIVTDSDTPPLNYAPTGVAVGFGTNHVAAQANYVNVLFADGHVESLKFDPKNAVAVRQPGGGYFWFPNP